MNTSLVVGMLFAVGYPTVLVLLARFRAVLRTRAPFLVHQAAMVAIVTGWALLRQPLGIALNGGWLLAAGVWWWVRRGQGRG